MAILRNKVLKIAVDLMMCNFKY